MRTIETRRKHTVTVRIFDWYSIGVAIKKCKEKIAKKHLELFECLGKNSPRHIGRSRLVELSDGEITYEVWISPARSES